MDRTKNQLRSINILKKRLVEQYLAEHTPETDSLTTAYLIRNLEEIMLERTGMGATGESYLVSQEGQMITPSRFLPDSLPGRISVHTRGFREALADNPGVGVYPDYRGVPIIGAYRKLSAPTDWVILTEIDMAEAMQPVHRLRNRFLVFILGLLAISWLVSVFLAKQLSRPIRALQQDIQTLAKGVLPPERPRNSRVREINTISASLDELIQALRRTADFAQQIGQGAFDAVHRPLSEYDELGRALLQMRDQLRQLNARKEALERETKQLLVSTQEAERERIARDIHDGIGPLLTTAKLKLTSLALPSDATREVRMLLDEVIAEVRRISSNLMPAVLSDFGPGEALRQLASEVEKNTALTVRYANDLLAPSRLNKETGIALYRIAQEAINNTLKHAQATEIVMSLTEFDDQVIFYYKDNGVGFDPVRLRNSDGKGLKNIHERVRILGGTVHIYREQGTLIEAEIPIV
ncbi:MAG: histidine kinase [Tunicatimonas sp.]